MQPVRPSTLTSSGTALDPSLSLRPGPTRVADSGWRCQMPPASPTAVALGQGCTISEHLGRDGREPPSETVLDMVPTRHSSGIAVRCGVRGSLLTPASHWRSKALGAARARPLRAPILRADMGGWAWTLPNSNQQ
jgi:hypothetical protein